jgi:hypothetical protein
VKTANQTLTNELRHHLIRGKKKPRSTTTTSDNSELDADGPRKKKKTTNNKGLHAQMPAAGQKRFAN